MNSTIKRKGGAEKVRQNKKKMLTLIGHKCAKVSDFFKLKQTNGNSSTNILPGSTESIFEENEKVQTITRECQIYTHDEVLPICSDVKSMNEISDVSSDPSAKEKAVNINDPIHSLPTIRLEFRQRIFEGPFRPFLSSFPRTKQGNYNRSFQQQWYSDFEWLESISIELDSAFCFPCRCFSGNEINSSQLENAFSKTGFNNWYRGMDRFKKHQRSKAHLNSSISLVTFLNSKSIDEVIDSNKTLIVQKREVERSENRKIMERLINIAICLSKGGRPFRGHNEKNDSVQQGLFNSFMHGVS